MHQSELQRIRKKSKIKVGFVLIHHSVWKFHHTFMAMLESDRFEPSVYVAPYLGQGPEKSKEELDLAYAFCQSKGYPIGNDVYDSDIVFFTNPHKLTSNEYYENLYLSKLSCHTPYSWGAVYLNQNHNFYNQAFHNAMWRIYVASEKQVDIFKSSRVAGSEGIFSTGYCGVEGFDDSATHETYKSWATTTKKRIIWAPHHTIMMAGLPLSNFLKIAEEMTNFKNSFSNDIEWAFRPHPLLKYNLYRHQDWGRSRTDEFYEDWSSNHSHFSEGDYEGVFMTSDAMIHDSVSFMAEYQYTWKPSMYIDLDETARNSLNEPGNDAYECHHIARKPEDVSVFIENLVNGAVAPKAAINKFHELHSTNTLPPSQNIINDLLAAIDRP
jgi:hypothetical protein